MKTNLNKLQQNKFISVITVLFGTLFCLSLTTRVEAAPYNTYWTIYNKTSTAWTITTGDNSCTDNTAKNFNVTIPAKGQTAVPLILMNNNNDGGSYPECWDSDGWVKLQFTADTSPTETINLQIDAIIKLVDNTKQGVATPSTYQNNSSNYHLVAYSNAHNDNPPSNAICIENGGDARPLTWVSIDQSCAPPT